MAGKWTVDRMPDQSGRTVVVTGANSGLGYWATAAFARAGATVVMACRSEQRGADAADDVRADVPDADLDVRRLDLADLDSVAAFAADFEADYDALDALCNNAGVMAIPYRETTDGFETQFGVNHLGHFALTGHLLDRLREANGESRVVTQSSGLHERGEIDFASVAPRATGTASGEAAGGDLQGEEQYDKWDAYAQSKLANLLFAFELDRRLDAAGIDDVTSVGCHPGYADTNLQRRGPEQSGSTLRLYMMKIANAVFAQDPEQGALPMLYAATADGIEGGEYVGPGGFMDMRGYPTEATPSDRARDLDAAARLWGVSEELTGVEYDLEAPRAEPAEK
jgi:NAD(P)-dependent dehydrogenase (short-subunit alcohol dehydrogenase family)